MSNIQQLRIGQKVRVTDPEFAQDWDGEWFIRELGIDGWGREKITISDDMERLGGFDGWTAKSLTPVEPDELTTEVAEHRDFYAKLTRLLVAAEGDDLIEVVENICNQRDALARRVEELSKDKAMLDLSEEYGLSICKYHGRWHVERKDGSHYDGATLREALTNATKGEIHE